MDRDIISPSLWKKIEEQWQHDDLFGPWDYSNKLDIAPEGWGIGPGESDGFQETEELFLAASQKFESIDESSEPEIDELFKVASQQIKKSKLEDRFAEPVSSKEIAELRQSAIPKKTQKSTAWGLKIWRDWAEHRRDNLRDDEERSQDLLPDFVRMTVSNMNFWLCKFVAEARHVDGQPYPPNMLYQICCALLRALRENDRADVNFFNDPKFSAFKCTLDAKMKELQASGKYMPKKAQPITIEHKDILWEKGLLGDHLPQALIDTLVFYVGMCFVLRNGEEHRCLRYHPAQIELDKVFP